MYAIIRRDNSTVDSMSVSAVSGAIPQKDAPVQAKTSTVDIKV
jgi:hypothetical protein